MHTVFMNNCEQVPKEFWREAASQGQIFIAGKILCDSRQAGAFPPAAAVAVIDFCLAAWNAATVVRTGSHAFQRAGQPQKIVLSVGDLDPNLTHDSLDRHKSAPKRHLDPFTRFCTVMFTHVPNT